MTEQTDNDIQSSISPGDKNYIDSCIDDLVSDKEIVDRYVHLKLGQVMAWGEEKVSIYALDSLIGIIEKAPYDINDDDNLKILQRIGAIDAISYAYLLSFHRNPEISKRIVDTFISRRQKLDKNTYYLVLDSLESTNKEELRAKEYVKIKDFFEMIIRNEKNPENLLNVFQCFLDGQNIVDFSVKAKEMVLMRHMIKNAKYIQELFSGYLGKAFQKDMNFDNTNKANYNEQYNITSLYSTFFSFFKDLNPETRDEIEKTLFPRIIETIRTHPDDGIRYSYIWPLETIINIPEQIEPKLLEQQTRMEIEILKALSEVVKEPLPKDKQILFTAPYRAYKVLADMLNLYTKGVISNSKAQILMNTRYHDEYKEAFITLINHIPKDKEIRLQYLQRLTNFINISSLDNPKHPFLIQGSKFLSEHYKGIADKKGL